MSINIRLRIITTLIFILANVSVWSQQFNQALEFYCNQKLNKQLNQSTKIFHTGFKPLIDTLNADTDPDSASFLPNRDNIISDKFKSSWFYRKLRKEDFIHLKSENFILKINPLFNLTYSRDWDAEQTAYNNTRGIEIKGSVGTKFSFYSAFYENQSRFEPYITAEMLNSLVAPGQGAVKILENNKFDFSRATGYLSYSPVSNLNIQAGHSKHFIGEGYRSSLLSDNSFNYPFLKISATFGKLQYTILWNQYQSFNGAYYNYHHRKYGAINYLSWVPKPGYEIALFESVMWPGNTAENNNNFNLNYFNPLLFSRSLIYGLNNEKNILLGINTKIRIYKFAQFFGQLALDNLDRENVSENNYAFQVGIKHFDLFHEKLKNQTIFFHAEYNFIAPYTYSWKDPLQSYTHYNQSLTHPSGTGLKEILVTTKYNFKDLGLVLRGSYLENSIDTMSTNFGSNPFLPSELIDGVISNIGNKPGQGIKNELIHFYAELSFCINQATNMKLFLGAHYRKSMNTINKNESMFYTIGIKTDLNNYYYDF